MSLSMWQNTGIRTDDRRYFASFRPGFWILLARVNVNGKQDSVGGAEVIMTPMIKYYGRRQSTRTRDGLRRK